MFLGNPPKRVLRIRTHWDSEGPLPATLDEVELVDRTLRGDRDAFRVIVLQHQRRLTELVYRQTGDRSGAEDLVQETFLRAYTALSRFDTRYRLSTWLTRIALNVARDSGRRKKVRDASLDRIGRAAEAAATSGPFENVARYEAQQTVLKALDTLSIPQREALVLSVYGGFTQREIASILETPLGTVKSRLRAALSKLRDVVAPLHPGGAEK